MDVDSLGRRRGPDQGRGLRPIHPRLPDEWTSKAIRVAMSESDWSRFEAIVGALSAVDPAPTQARAYGQALARLIQRADPSTPGISDWMDWERQKTLRLLRHAV